MNKKLHVSICVEILISGLKKPRNCPRLEETQEFLKSEG